MVLFLTLIFATNASCTASCTRTLNTEGESDRNVKNTRRKEPVGGDASLPCVAELARHTAGHLRKFCDFQPKMDVKRVTARSRSAVGKTRKAALPPSSRPRRFTVEEDCAYNNFPT